jgi:nucleotidyltransferase substrate binding protein (TIGR01987 family)
MDKRIIYKAAQIEKMLVTLDKANSLYQKKLSQTPNHEHHVNEELLAFRDSVIKRLEYCVDAFWKLIKTYLEDAQGLTLTETGPKPIARTAALNHVISEQESNDLIIMIEERNKTSHMYREEIADEIAKHAQKAHSLMHTVFARIMHKKISPTSQKKD